MPKKNICAANPNPKMNWMQRRNKSHWSVVVVHVACSRVALQQPTKLHVSERTREKKNCAQKENKTAAARKHNLLSEQTRICISFSIFQQQINNIYYKRIILFCAPRSLPFLSLSLSSYERGQCCGHSISRTILQNEIYKLFGCVLCTAVMC